MAIIIIAGLITSLNIILWIIFAVKFKKIFSTDEIISKTRNELNSMLSDINRNADRNITLIEDRIRQLKAVTAEAERRLSVLKGELDKTQKTQILQSKMETARIYNMDYKGSKQESYEKGKPLSASTSLEKYRKEKVSGEIYKEKLQQQNVASSILPTVTVSSSQIVPKKDFYTQVKELASQGKTVDEIAAELDRSTQEVKFTLEIS